MKINQITNIRFSANKNNTEKEIIKTPRQFNSWLRSREPIFQEANSSQIQWREQNPISEYIKKRKERQINKQIANSCPIESSLKNKFEVFKSELAEFKEASSLFNAKDYETCLISGLDKYTGLRLGGNYIFKNIRELYEKLK